MRITPRLDWRRIEGAGAVPPGASIGGLAAQVNRLTQATAPLGVEQTVLALRPTGGPRQASLAPRAQVLGVGPAGVPGVHRSQLAWLAALLPRLARARERCDVVHVHASGVIEPLLAAIAARVLVRRPIVLTLHCSALVTVVAQSRRDVLVQMVTRVAERLAIRLAARTLVLTDVTRAALARPRVETFPDCLEAARYGPHRGGGKRPTVLFVGRASREKGIDAAIALAGGDRCVVICGDGPELAALRAGADPDAVSFRGAVSEDEVAAAMRDADVLVLPSAHEELGSVLLEATAAGLPAVAYDVGGTREAIVDGVTGRLVPRGDRAALARTVTAVLADSALRERARTEGPRRAAERYDVGVAGRRLLAVYREVTA
jgi:glycosyltransferase involved in cell wall biosynthesis